MDSGSFTFRKESRDKLNSANYRSSFRPVSYTHLDVYKRQGTFVSCKDYDDEIDEINATLTDLKSQLAALQTKVENGD